MNTNMILSNSGLMKKDLAKAMGLSPQSMASRLQSKADWTIDETCAAADFFGVPLMALLYPKVKRPRPHPRPCPDKVILAALARASESEIIMLRLGAECGLRRGEIGRVSSGDVVDDLVGRSLVVNGKGDKQRIVPLPDDLADLISACDGYVFPGRFGGHVEESYIGDRLSSLLGDGWTAHSLRHRYATATWQATHDLLLVSKLLGHASVETTQVYVAMPDERLRAGMAAVLLSA